MRTDRQRKKQATNSRSAKALDKALGFVADAPKTPSFYDRVYAIVEQIPVGKVTTYGSIAEVLGLRSSSRLVGHALNAIPQTPELPAHRVINRIGALSGAHHFGGYDVMRRMLEKEGVTFKGELVDMEKHYWKPPVADPTD